MNSYLGLFYDSIYSIIVGTKNSILFYLPSIDTIFILGVYLNVNISKQQKQQEQKLKNLNRYTKYLQGEILKHWYRLIVQANKN